MEKSPKLLLFLLRVSLGWLFLYAGLTKLLDPTWTSEGYLTGAKAFTGFFSWLASPDLLPIVDFMNEWGLTLLGVSLILGLFVRLSAMLGALLMLLYYLPLGLPFPDEHSLIVDDHIVYALTLLYFAAVRAGRTYGLENFCAKLPVCKRFPKLRNFLG